MQYCTTGQNQEAAPLTPLYVSHIIALAQFQIDRETKAQGGVLTLVDNCFMTKNRSLRFKTHLPLCHLDCYDLDVAPNRSEQDRKCYR
jgi:hypothetical protein